jgi:hypothetical protein
MRIFYRKEGKMTKSKLIPIEEELMKNLEKLHLFTTVEEWRLIQEALQDAWDDGYEIGSKN